MPVSSSSYGLVTFAVTDTGFMTVAATYGINIPINPLSPLTRSANCLQLELRGQLFQFSGQLVEPLDRDLRLLRTGRDLLHRTIDAHHRL